MYIFSPWGLCGPYGCWTNVISLPPIGATIHFHNSHMYNRGWGDGGGRGHILQLLYCYFHSLSQTDIFKSDAFSQNLINVNYKWKKMP